FVAADAVDPVLERREGPELRQLAQHDDLDVLVDVLEVLITERSAPAEIQATKEPRDAANALLEGHFGHLVALQYCGDEVRFGSGVERVGWHGQVRGAGGSFTISDEARAQSTT